MKTGTNLPVFYYIIHIIIGEFMKNTLLVNLYAGPGAGKSTGAAYIFAKLKMAGVDCEYVSEYAKDRVWQEDQFPLKHCQLYVTR